MLSKREKKKTKKISKKYLKQVKTDPKLSTEKALKHVRDTFKPQKLKTADEAWMKFEAFLRYCKENAVPMTLERLAIFLGINRAALLRYAENAPKELAEAVQRMRDFVLAEKVERLMTVQNVTGIIFDLKNNEGFRDKTEVEHSGEVTFNQRLRAAISKSKDIKLQ